MGILEEINKSPKEIMQYFQNGAIISKNEVTQIQIFKLERVL